jgi:hypothetical protein
MMQKLSVQIEIEQTGLRLQSNSMGNIDVPAEHY